jgi:hypothetical protein
MCTVIRPTGTRATCASLVRASCSPLIMTTHPDYATGSLPPKSKVRRNVALTGAGRSEAETGHCGITVLELIFQLSCVIWQSCCVIWHSRCVIHTTSYAHEAKNRAVVSVPAARDTSASISRTEREVLVGAGDVLEPDDPPCECDHDE